MHLTQRKTLLCALASAVLLFGAGCGDDDGNGNGDTSCDPKFGQAQACGGALTGSYKYVKACVDDSVWSKLKGSCTAAQISNVATAPPTGTLSFTGNNYNLDAKTTITGNAKIPVSCVGSCALIATGISSYIPGATANCYSGTTCDCQISVPYSYKHSGAFTTSGGIATLKTSEKYYYCVSGNVLRYHGVAGTTADSNITYVLTR